MTDDTSIFEEVLDETKAKKKRRRVIAPPIPQPQEIPEEPSFEELEPKPPSPTTPPPTPPPTPPQPEPAQPAPRPVPQPTPSPPTEPVPPTTEPEERVHVSEAGERIAEELEEVPRRLHQKFPDVKVEFEKLEPRRMPKVVITIYGDKGEGKTWLALTLPGDKLLIDFDGKGKPVAEYLYDWHVNKMGMKLWVVNGLKYDSAEIEEQPITGMKSYQHLKMVLDSMRESGQMVDWVIFDNTDKYHELLERAMRYTFGIGPYEGIANRNVWKLRKAFLRELHYKALQIARKGIVYTCYPETQEIIEGGDILAKKQKPKWLDIVLYETDIVVRVRAKSNHKEFEAVIESSKVPRFLEGGQVLDVTGAGFMKYLGGGEKS